jgi:hypothetical protein
MLTLTIAFISEAVITVMASDSCFYKKAECPTKRVEYSLRISGAFSCEKVRPGSYNISFYALSGSELYTRIFRAAQAQKGCLLWKILNIFCS